jgi:hypothetical protein
MPAGAEVSGADAASARALFDDARRLMDQGRYDEACPKFEQASRIDPDANGIRYNLATCYEHLGRLASAWGLFSEVASRERLAGRTDRHELAKERADAIAPRVPHLRIVVPTPAPGIQVRRDGNIVAPPLLDTGIPVDPGEHVVAANAPEREGWSERVVVAEGSSYEVVVPVLASTAERTERTSPPRRDRGGGTSTGRVAALVAGVTGAGAVAIGSAFGIRAIVLAHDASGRCPNDGCDPQGFSDRTDSRTSGNVSTGFFIGGAVLLAAGTILWLTVGKAGTAGTQ